MVLTLVAGVGRRGARAAARPRRAGAAARRRSGARRGEAEVLGPRQRQGTAAAVAGAARHADWEEGEWSLTCGTHLSQHADMASRSSVVVKTRVKTT